MPDLAISAFFMISSRAHKLVLAYFFALSRRFHFWRPSKSALHSKQDCFGSVPSTQKRSRLAISCDYNRRTARASCRHIQESNESGFVGVLKRRFIGPWWAITQVPHGNTNRKTMFRFLGKIRRLATKAKRPSAKGARSLGKVSA